MAQKRAAAKAAVEALHREFDELLEQRQLLLAAHWDHHRQQQTSPTAVGELAPNEEKAEATAPTSLVVDDFTRAVELENALLAERERLQSTLTSFDIFESWLHRDVPRLEDRERNADNVGRRREGEQPGVDCGGRWEHFTADEQPFNFEPVDAATCLQFVNEHYPSLLHHHAVFTQQALDWGTDSFLGWQVQRSTLNGRHFHFSKLIPSGSGRHSVVSIVDEAWTVLHTPSEFQRLFRARVVMRVLQHVDATNSVILQNVPAPDNSVGRRCVLVASKVVHTEEDGQDAVGIVLLGVAPHEDLARAQSPVVQFTHDVSAYLLLRRCVDERGEEFVTMSFGGHGDHRSDAEADFVFLEVAHALFQFEQRVLPLDVVAQG